MSFAHIRLKKISEDRDNITYAALSPDFNDLSEWQEVARVAIDRAGGTHEFLPINAWAHLKVVPPYVYGLNEDERRKILSSEFIDYRCGAWTGRIWSLIYRMQASNSFPEICP